MRCYLTLRAMLLWGKVNLQADHPAQKAVRTLLSNRVQKKVSRSTCAMACMLVFHRQVGFHEL